MVTFRTTPCLHCGGDIAVPEASTAQPRYHEACAWQDIPCRICGKPVTIRRSWEHPPTAHKACIEERKALRREKPCEFCGKPIKYFLNAVKIPRFHPKCESEVKLGKRHGRSLRVFLCHSSTDKEAVRALRTRLVEDHFLPWLDEVDILPGQDWDAEIRSAVRTSHAIVVCLSPGAIAKAGYLHKEIRMALDVAEEQPDGTIFLIPVKLAECDTPVRLQKWQSLSLFHQEGYPRLVRALRVRATALFGPPRDA